MSRRKIFEACRIETGVVVKIYWDSEWQEFQAELHLLIGDNKWKRDDKATYHTTEMADAEHTAWDMLDRASKQIITRNRRQLKGATYGSR